MKVWDSKATFGPEEAQPMPHPLAGRPLWSIGILLALFVPTAAEEPPAINPFGPKSDAREDAVPGYIETSDGKITPGMLYLTRDMRLKINDQSIQRQREIPLRVVKQIDCAVKKEWMEREWRFKELASDEKLYTGRSYPAREYEHTITLRDGRTIRGPLAAIVYRPARGPQGRIFRVPDGGPGRAVLPSQARQGQGGHRFEVAGVRPSN